MINRQRTLEVYGYDIDPNKKSRRSDAEFAATGGLNKKQLTVVDNCPSCGKERTIKYRASLKNKQCSQCHHNSPEMVATKKAQKGKTVSDQAKANMKANHWSTKGIVSPFKGEKHTKETKSILAVCTKTFLANLDPDEKMRRYIKASCTVRNIKEEEFDGWATAEGLRLRSTSEYKEFEKQVIQRDVKCVVPGCSKRKKKLLTVHHKDGFHWCIDKRTDVSNGVLLCYPHHEEFHSIYKKRNNTEAQFDEWLSSYEDKVKKNKTLYIVTGVFGSGKSWVCNQLKDLSYYLAYDSVTKDQHGLKIEEMLSKVDSILYDPMRKASTIANRYGQLYTVKMVVIDENIDVIRERLSQRGGDSENPKLEKYIKNFSSMKKRATFSGTSQEVLDYLKKELSGG